MGSKARQENSIRLRFAERSQLDGEIFYEDFARRTLHGYICVVSAMSIKDVPPGFPALYNTGFRYVENERSSQCQDRKI